MTDRVRDATGDGAVPWPAMIGVIATVSVFAVAQGLSYPLLSFILQRQGVSPGLVGLSAAMTPLGYICSSLATPWMAARFGAGRLALACALLGAGFLAAIGWTQDLWLWFPLRFLLGFFVNPLYIISETWLIGLAPPARRGRILGLYTSVISAGFAVGPLTLTLVGSEGWAPFAVGIAAFVGCALCLALVLPRLPPLGGDRSHDSPMRFLPLAPVLLFAVFTAAAFEQALLSLLAVYGAARGVAEATVSTLLTVFIAGNIAFQIPLGRMAERHGARSMLSACAAACAIGSAALPIAFGTAAIWPVMFVWGAVAFGIYTMALVELGERFSGSMLMAGNAAFSMLWGVGGIAGPPLGGAAMELLGAEGLPLVLGLACALLAFAAGARPRGKAAR